MSELTSLPEIVQAAIEANAAELRVGMPGIIQSFDEDTQLASVQPCLSDTVIQDGVRTDYELPVINNVNVIFYGSLRHVITCGIDPGTECWLEFADRSMDGWRISGNTAAPQALYYHNLTDAVAHVGLRSYRHKLPVFDNDKVTIGNVDGVTYAVALAEAVRTELQNIVDWAHAHKHTGVTTGPGTSEVAATTIPPLALTVPSVGSTVVQTRE